MKFLSKKTSPSHSSQPAQDRTWRYRPTGVLLLGLFLLFDVAALDAAPPQGAGASDVPSVINVWKETASKSGVSEAAITRVAELVEPPLRSAKVQPSREQLDQLARDLPKCFSSTKPMLNVEGEKTTGAEYYVAYSIIELFCRRTENQPPALLKKEQNELIGKIAKSIEAGVVAKLPESEKEHLKPDVEKRTTALADECAKKFSELRDNALFPGFKHHLDDPTQQSILAAFDHAELYPTLTEPEQLMVTPQEGYKSQLDGFYRQMVVRVVYEWLAAEFISELEEVPYWGKMDVGVYSLPGSAWPVFVNLRPAKSDRPVGKN